MTTIRATEPSRLTIAAAKRLVLENSPREMFVQIYQHKDGGELVAVPDTKPSSIFAAHLDEDFASNCESLGIVPRFKYRPGLTGYTGDPTTDDSYTISRDELARLADLHGLTLEVGPALVNNEDGTAATPLASDRPLTTDTPNKWTADRMAELSAYRATHGTKAAAEHFGVSTSRVRQLLPSEKPAPKGYSAFNPRQK